VATHSPLTQTVQVQLPVTLSRFTQAIILSRVGEINNNIILFVLKVQPNTTYELFARKKNKQRCIEKSAIVNRYKES